MVNLPDGEVDPRFLSAHEDPASGAPWAMPIVVRAEKDALPTATTVAQCCASAVVTLLDDPRCAEGGEWAGDVDRWLDGRIRKVARRARGSRWDAVQALAGVTLDRLGAQVRAFVPMPTDALPPEMSKLQVSGLELPIGEADLSTPNALKIALTPHVSMSALKAAVQVAHAAQLARAAMSVDELYYWRQTGFDVRLVRPDAASWARYVATARVTVRDAGFTEIPPGTRTTVSLW
jgi:peptidyl-tRNA hydrolase